MKFILKNFYFSRPCDEHSEPPEHEERHSKSAEKEKRPRSAKSPVKKEKFERKGTSRTKISITEQIHVKKKSEKPKIQKPKKSTNKEFKRSKTSSKKEVKRNSDMSERFSDVPVLILGKIFDLQC